MTSRKYHVKLFGLVLACQEENTKDIGCQDKMYSQPHPDVIHKSTLVKPSLFYISLIATAILSSPQKKLSLASIYNCIEEQHPFYQAQGQGWRNSVQHNLSLNDCFIKVGRCEDGKGHYWGIHPAYLKDITHGDFKKHRRVKKKELQKEVNAHILNIVHPYKACPHCSWPQAFFTRSYSISSTPLWQCSLLSVSQFCKTHDFRFTPENNRELVHLSCQTLGQNKACLKESGDGKGKERNETEL
uniref:Fork-head domain-containing protein n=1 Tax=Erpetoichthys calabaricus TaxID=27687 RepID=A0A8C4RJJ7_ERPCA